jgi:hypothetical protein
VDFSSTLAELYPQVRSMDQFASWTRQVLEPYGFRRGNALPLLGVCRDELMFAVEHRLHEEWGPAFDLSSLAAMVFLGRSGIQAAAHHAPDADGRRRFVIIVLPHIGIEADGGVGRVRRDGQPEPSTACGALVQVQLELQSGQLNLELDRHDLELSLVRMELLRRLRYGTVPDLPALTELARQAGVAAIERLTRELTAEADTDVAIFSGTVMHGPHADFVVPSQAWVSIGSDDRQPLQAL